MQEIRCPGCEKNFDIKADVCPHCGKPSPWKSPTKRSAEPSKPAGPSPMDILVAKSGVTKPPTFLQWLHGWFYRYLAGLLMVFGAVFGGFPLSKLGRTPWGPGMMAGMITFFVVGAILFVAGTVLLVKGLKKQGLSDKEIVEVVDRETRDAGMGGGMASM